jgi:hypothetical protein
MAVRLSALRAGRALHPRNLPGTHFCYRLSRPQGHSATGRIRSIEKIHLIGTRTRDLPVCSIVPQPTPNIKTKAPRTCVRFGVLTSVTINNMVFRVALLSISENARRFERTYRLYLYGQRVGHGTSHQEADGKQTCKAV